jgi:hypothetical protein
MHWSDRSSRVERCTGTRGCGRWRLRPALRPGGTLAIVDAQPGEDPAQRWYLGLYALGLRLRTAAGAVYPLERYASWTQEAGYRDLSAVSLSEQPALALLTCTAPGR